MADNRQKAVSRKRGPASNKPIADGGISKDGKRDGVTRRWGEP